MNNPYLLRALFHLARLNRRPAPAQPLTPTYLRDRADELEREGFKMRSSAFAAPCAAL